MRTNRVRHPAGERKKRYVENRDVKRREGRNSPAPELVSSNKASWRSEWKSRDKTRSSRANRLRVIRQCVRQRRSADGKCVFLYRVCVCSSRPPSLRCCCRFSPLCFFLCEMRWGDDVRTLLLRTANPEGAYFALRASCFQWECKHYNNLRWFSEELLLHLNLRRRVSVNAPLPLTSVSQLACWLINITLNEIIIHNKNNTVYSKSALFYNSMCPYNNIFLNYSEILMFVFVQYSFVSVCDITLLQPAKCYIKVFTGKAQESYL